MKLSCFCLYPHVGLTSTKDHDIVLSTSWLMSKVSFNISTTFPVLPLSPNVWHYYIETCNMYCQSWKQDIFLCSY